MSLSPERELWMLEKNLEYQATKLPYHRRSRDEILKPRISDRKKRAIIAEYLRQYLNSALREYFRNGVDRKLRHTRCRVSEVVKHIEGQFMDGMSWENKGEWHIDHIRPLCSFDLMSTSEWCKAVRKENLQPLWAKENMSKGRKWSEYIPSGV